MHGLQGSDWLWDRLRPLYNKVLALCGPHGLERIMNGTDRIRVLPEFRGIMESYEPDVWKQLMARIRQGDIVADVGAYVGLYSVALAKRVGPSGRVFAFEPDTENFRALEAHCSLNEVTGHVTLLPHAASERDGVVRFVEGRQSQSYVGGGAASSRTVNAVRLDNVIADGRLDILKIDVEGYEEKVLEGARQVLQDSRRGPRAIYIEVHPYAWPPLGTTSASLIALLREFGYQVVDLRGEPVELIECYGEIVAQK